MDNKQLFKNLNSIIKSIALNDGNEKYLNIIREPSKYAFHHSRPGKYNQAAVQNNGETAWQRELYEKESGIWVDLELPIGQYQPNNNRYISLRVDLIGKKDGRFVLSELKKTKNAGQPFDAILQLIAYYVLLQYNYKQLDKQDIHHANCNKDWTWEEVYNNPILLLRANDEYWGNWNKQTKKNKAAREIVEFCRTNNIDIRLYCNEQEISICG